MLQLRFVGQDKPPVWLVETHYVLGSDTSCSLYLTGVGILPRHAELVVSGEQLTLKPLVSGASLAVDGLQITRPTPLAHNNRLTLGDVQLLVVDPKKQKTSGEAPIPPSTDWYLVSTTTALANRRFPIAGSMTIGRSAECDISLGVAHLSRKHARLWVEEGGQLWVEDLDSSNGTFVNSQRVRRTQLKQGDLLGLDTLIFSVLGGPDSPESDGEKTSLRPSLNTVNISSSISAAPRPAPTTRSTDLKIRPPQNSAGLMQPSQTSGSWQLWLGLLVVGFLTLAAVYYLLN